MVICCVLTVIIVPSAFAGARANQGQKDCDVPWLSVVYWLLSLCPLRLPVLGQTKVRRVVIYHGYLLCILTVIIVPSAFAGSRQTKVRSTDIETEIPKFQYRPRKFFSRHGEQFGGIRDFAEKRCGECAMHITRAITLMCVAEVAALLARLKNAHIAERCSWHTHFPSKTEYPQIALHAGKKLRPTLGSPLYIYGKKGCDVPWLSVVHWLLSLCFLRLLVLGKPR